MPHKDRKVRLEYLRKYREKHRERIRAQLKEHDKRRRGKRRVYMHAYYLANEESVKANNLKWKLANPDKFRRIIAKAKLRYMQKRPEIQKAYSILHNALRVGVLEKKPCQICGNKISEAHHDDYSKPLHVMWLCRQHHSALHKKRRRENW